MAQKSKRFFSMRLLRWNVKSSRLDVLQKGILKIFAKSTRKTLYWLLWVYWDSTAGVFIWIWQNFKFTQHLTITRLQTWLVSWKLINIFCYPCLMEDLNSLQEIFHNSIHWNHVEIFRSSHWRCFLRKDILRNFAKFTGKHLC